ncbi:MAG: hypothetical protein Q8877_03380, partial [Sweet potato little leaf phytoplasma]|nr:hypothetical protein [Sweet potato little leaf phytoplasma]
QFFLSLASISFYTALPNLQKFSFFIQSVALLHDGEKVLHKGNFNLSKYSNINGYVHYVV